MRRRNATLWFEPAGGGMQVRKSYQRCYSVAEEARAYERLGRLLNGRSGLRVAVVYGVDPAREELCLEYVEGRTLAEWIRLEGFEAAAGYADRLCALFREARASEFGFDSDPANLIVEPGGGLVCIDPVCRPPAVADYCFVAFMTGLLKEWLRRPGWRRTGSFRRCWRRYLDSYGSVGGPGLGRQFGAYIRRIIGWNLWESGAEPVGRRVVRYSVLTPGWALVWLAFALRVIPVERKSENHKSQITKYEI